MGEEKLREDTILANLAKWRTVEWMGAGTKLLTGSKQQGQIDSVSDKVAGAHLSWFQSQLERT